MGRMPTDVFVQRDGFTTVGAACAILVSCSLVFACIWTVRSYSRASGVQAVADAAVLAAENEVAEFVIAVRVADATLLTLSLTGLALFGVGSVCRHSEGKHNRKRRHEGVFVVLHTLLEELKTELGLTFYESFVG